MRKLAVIFGLAFLLALTLNSNIMAQDEIEMDIEIWKSAFSHGVYYGIEFELNGNGVKNARWVLINLPNGKKMWLRNTIGLNEICLEAWDMSYEEFNNRFPEGKYRIILFPKQYGKLIVNMTHDFPQTPVITYPADGATDVPLTLTIEWEPLSDIDGLWLEFGGEGLEAEVDLPIDTTSFTFPAGMLQPNTQYELCLNAERTDGRDNDLVSFSDYIFHNWNRIAVFLPPPMQAT